MCANLKLERETIVLDYTLPIEMASNSLAELFQCLKFN
jgi:hypothetical protein